MVWVTAGAVLPPPAALTWQPLDTAAGWLAVADVPVFTLVLDPLDPPPRNSF